MCTFNSMKTLEFPLARITISFVLGILIAYYLKPTPEFVFALLFIAGIIFSISYFLSKRKTTNAVYFGLTTYLLAFGIGASTQIVHTDYFQKNNYVHCKSVFDQPHWISLTLREKLKSTSFNERYIAIINQIDGRKYSGRVLLNIKKDSLNRPLEMGTHLKLNGAFYKQLPSKNPSQFDYSNYLENIQIYAQIYTGANDIKISSVINKDIWYYSSRLRTKILKNLEKNHFNSAELNVAAALILGQQQDISPEIIRDYQYAGAVHILSVSGLHIGFILLFVTFILKPFPNTRRGAFIKLIIILLSLISFGIIAGLAPSVVRSVTMFSFVAIGMYLRRSTNIFHTLLVSILIILLFQPSFLFNVGFQLSYVALFFILWLQPLLANLWLPKNKVAKYLWDILTVSFAAQIGAFPLSIYYFHQFPGLFFVTNLVVIPFLSIIMALGVLVMVLAAFDYVPLFLSKSLEWLILCMNKIINWVASFEQFIIRDIPFNWYFLVSLYLLIITIILWFKKPDFTRLVSILISVIVLQVTYFETHSTTQSQRELVVFNIKKNTLITERTGENVALFANKGLLTTVDKNKNLTSYLMANFSSLKSKNRVKNLLFFDGKKILIVDSLGVYPKNIRPDIMLITQSPKINFERLFQTLKPKMVVADASNYRSYVDFWKATCLKQEIPFHATGEKGFYRIN